MQSCLLPEMFYQIQLTWWKTHTGEITAEDRAAEIWSSSCVPEPEIKWDQCVNRDESLAGTPDSTIDNTDLIACSYNCYSDENCLNWLWNAQSRQCSLINAQMAESDRSKATHNYNGQKSCVGKVDIINENKAFVDGNWSPWSTLATPCFEERTGQLLDCGGGVQYR